MKFKSIIPTVLLCATLLCGCAGRTEYAPIAATTLPVYEFTLRLCDGTGLSVTRLVTENVSCLHDYTLNVAQVRAIEVSETVVTNGSGLEEFMDDILADTNVIDSSEGIEIIEYEEGHDHHAVEVLNDHEGHHHEQDSHIWLSPANAAHMAQNICDGLCARYPAYQSTFLENLSSLLADLETLQSYGEQALADLTCRDMITFHDGFAYFADAFDLHILRAVEEDSGAEASAAELKELIGLVREHGLPAIFIEANGSDSAATVISRETGSALYTLDMAMSGNNYFEAMYHNIDTIKEAMG